MQVLQFPSFSRIQPVASIMGGWLAGRNPQILGRGSSNIIISYHVQEICSKVVTFEEKYLE